MINLKNFIKKHQLIIILSFIATVLFILKFFLLPKESLPQVLPTPTPTPTPTATSIPSPFPAGRGDPELLRSLLKETEQNFPLIEYLPYEDKNVSIDYTGPLKLKAILKTPQASQSAVLGWIRSKNINPATHKIEFVPF